MRLWAIVGPGHAEARRNLVLLDPPIAVAGQVNPR